MLWRQLRKKTRKATESGTVPIRLRKIINFENCWKAIRKFHLEVLIDQKSHESLKSERVNRLGFDVPFFWGFPNIIKTINFTTKNIGHKMFNKYGFILFSVVLKIEQ